MTDIYARSVQRYLLEVITKGRRRGTDGDGANAVTGEPFLTFATKRKKEGTEGDGYNTISEARDVFLGDWADYAKGKANHVLYVRAAPFVQLDYHTQKWYVYARLLLSDKELKP